MSFSKQRSVCGFPGISENKGMSLVQLHTGEMGKLEISCPVARCLSLAAECLWRSPSVIRELLNDDWWPFTWRSRGQRWAKPGEPPQLFPLCCRMWLPWGTDLWQVSLYPVGTDPLVSAMLRRFLFSFFQPLGLNYFFFPHRHMTVKKKHQRLKRSVWKAACHSKHRPGWHLFQGVAPEGQVCYSTAP